MASSAAPAPAAVKRPAVEATPTAIKADLAASLAREARELLLGLVALQSGLVDQTQLMDTLHTRTIDKAQPLACCLVNSGHLDAAHRPLLESLTAALLVRKGGNAFNGLAALEINGWTHHWQGMIDDPDIGNALAHVDLPSNLQEIANADGTTVYGAGTSMSNVRLAVGHYVRFSGSSLEPCGCGPRRR
jgi:hypothetical protein